VCTDTAAVANSAWIGKAAMCSKCPDGQIQRHRTKCDYPYDSSSVCIPIPLKGDTVVWERCENSSCTEIINKTIKHIVYDYGGVKYHAVGDRVNWWEAQEICEKLGLSLISKEKLVAIHSELYNGLFGGSGTPRVWSTQDNKDNCKAYLVRLKEGTWLLNSRNTIPGISYYALCGPKI
jgi:hypothetical protein